MGMSFLASNYRRWAFHVQPSFPKHRLSSPFRGSEALFESGRSAYHFSIEGEVHGDSLKACSLGTVYNIETVSIYEEQSKINDTEFFRGSYNSSRLINMTEDTSPYVASLKSSSHLQFRLLMENLDDIEDILAGKELIRLEKDILTHVRKLGALQLFHACLSKTLDPTTVNSNLMLTENFWDFPKQLDNTNTIVRTGKKEERKLKRRRTSSKVNDKVVYSKASVLKSGLSRIKRSSKLRRNRSFIARNESEMSRGVKEIAELEITRTKLEAEINHSASYARWAESAGINQKTLQQRLQFGWYCRDRLIRSTHSLVVYLAKNYRGMGIAFDDLLQAGKMGVLKGAERFDHTKGYRFSTYVQYWIRKSILALLDHHSKAVQIPVTMERYIKKINIARKNFYDSEGRYPHDEDLVNITGISLDNVRLARRCSRVGGSIDKELVAGWRTKYMEVTADTSIEDPDEIITKQHMRKDIKQVLEGLELRERQVLELRYGLHDGRCKSLGEIANLCCVTKEWIRKIEKSALTKIRSDDITKDLKCYINL